MSPPLPGIQEAVDHLFRRESGRMVAALTRLFGLHNLDLAEDVVQDTLVEALRRWPLVGVPENPAGWLYQVARNRAIDVVRRERRFRGFAPELTAMAAGAASPPDLETVFGASVLADDTLRLMFACCHPTLPIESQIAMTLKLLAGFGTAETARALLVHESAVEKRLYRAKQQIRAGSIPFEWPGSHDLQARLGAVLAVLYLMFNEGYSASFAEHPIRKDVCLESMRLAKLLAEHPVGDRPETAALLALMCFHVARFDARLDGDGHLVTLARQDRTRWSQPLIQAGFGYLARSGQGEMVSAFQVEAGIAALHCLAPRYEATDWAGILELYDILLRLKPTPVVALNRAIALAEVEGSAAALRLVEAIEEAGTLGDYYLLPATLGELYLRVGRAEEAERQLERARGLTSSEAERRFLDEKLRGLRASRA